MIDTLLLLIIILLLMARMGQSQRQHKELIEWLDAYAEMVGEAIDGMRNERD
jgi:competence protein ComGF